MEPGKNWCTSCGRFRDEDDFRRHPSGTRRKTCYRHMKRPVEETFDSWDRFLGEVQQWNRPGQTLPLKLNCVFDLERLPVSFGAKLVLSDDGESRRGPLNEAVGALAREIWGKGGYRFRCRESRDLHFVYRCSQDICCAGAAIRNRKRDRRIMKRFPCRSKLTFNISLENRSLKLTLEHGAWHTPYDNLALSPEVIDFINGRSSLSTPAEIFRDLTAAKKNRLRIPGSNLATQHQVRYQWQQANSSIWKRDPDQFVSATKLLSERSSEYLYSTIESGNLRGLAFYVKETITALAKDAKEVLMDATYGTNSNGMSLFAVLAELDGTGVPLAYCFVEHTAPGNPSPDSQTVLLVQFLSQLKSLDIKPSFFGVDKDMSEIAAVGQVWPTARIQLCYWHAKRAIRMRLRDGKKTASQARYFPGKAEALIPGLEVCWGSAAHRRPNGDHRYGRCQCPSRVVVFEEKGSVETSSKIDRATVLALFSQHFNAHPLFPRRSGINMNSQELHLECAREMYEWCRSRNYFRLWSYLFINWYSPGKWELWARAANDSEIPVLKTTMVVESHWRRLKHDYLHRFNRPRIDLVLWTLISRVIPDSQRTMTAIKSGPSRIASASWRKPFKKEWKKLAKQPMIADGVQAYHTDPVNWVCGCDNFLLSRFLLCEHLVQSQQPIENRYDFFASIKRRRTKPFWVEQQLVALPQFGSLSHTPAVDDEEDTGSEDSSDDSATDPDLSSDSEPEPEDDEEREADLDMDAVASAVESYAAIIKRQAALGNTKFFKDLTSTNTDIRALVDDVQRLQNRHTMQSTWGAYKHQSARYWEM